MDGGGERAGSVHDLVAGADLIREGVGVIAEGTALVRGARSWAVSDAELRTVVEDLTRAAAVLEAARLSAVKALDERPGAIDTVMPRGQAAVGGSSVAARFLVHRLHVDPGQARRDVEAAHALDSGTGTLPVMGAALAQGEVSRAHVDACVRVVRELPAHLATRLDPASGRTGLQIADAFLTGQARDASPRTTRWLADQLLARLAPERAERADVEAHHRRSWRQYLDATGITRVSIAVPPTDAAFLTALVATVAAPAPAGTAVDEDGQEVLVPDLRTRDQRIYDGMIATIRAGAGAPDGPGGAVTVLVTATPDQVANAAATLTGQRLTPAGLAHADHLGPLTPTTLARLTCGNTLQRVLLAPTGAALDLGRAVRLATPAQRKALAARDGGCVIPGCTIAVTGCDLHHLHGWATGGTTDLSNLVPLCPRHHTETHHGHWVLTIHGGVPWVRPPSWVDPYRQPLRNTTHHTARLAQAVGEQLRLLLDDDP